MPFITKANLKILKMRAESAEVYHRDYQDLCGRHHELQNDFLSVSLQRDNLQRAEASQRRNALSIHEERNELRRRCNDLEYERDDWQTAAAYHEQDAADARRQAESLRQGLDVVGKASAELAREVERLTGANDNLGQYILRQAEAKAEEQARCKELQMERDAALFLSLTQQRRIEELEYETDCWRCMNDIDPDAKIEFYDDREEDERAS